MTDFFVSYAKIDEPWAAWISWVLEKAGFSVIVQVWDFAAGGNFILEMQRAASEAPRTIAVLSPGYLESRYAAPEWAAAFAADPEGLKHRLVPVRVRECRLEGLWKSIIYIDLVGLDEANAQQKLLRQIEGKRAKPIERPAFPGATVAQSPPFPGVSRAGSARGPKPYMPKVRAAHSDLDKRKFLREAFLTVTQHFQRALENLDTTHPSIEVDLNDESTSRFTAEIFVNGKSKARCKIWIGNQFGEGIAYYQGNDWDGNALNEMLVVSETQNDLTLSAQMGTLAFGRMSEGLNLHQLSPVDGAEYLWRRFASSLE